MIDIIYRPDGDGKGAFWDHYTIQVASGCPTRALFIPLRDQEVTEKSAQKFREYLRSQTFGLPHSEHSHNLSKPCPPLVHVPFNDLDALKRTIEQPDAGLLVFPGSDAKIWMVDQDKIVERTNRVLKWCQTIGRPVLAICAGTIAIGKSVGWETHAVEGHASGRMMSLNGSGWVTCNSQMHRLIFESGTMLFALDQRSRFGCNVTERIRANSVHNVALVRTPPAGWIVSAYSTEALLSNRHDKKPQEEVTEAVESTFGVPMIGTQFHPEAYARSNPKSATTETPLDCAFHRSIIMYMSMSGNARVTKQCITRDLLLQQLGTLRRTTKSSTDAAILSTPQKASIFKTDMQEVLPTPPSTPEASEV